MKKIISPLAIDMGAKYTGVYYANYNQGATFEEIDKHGQVLVYENYTALLAGRTANRHTRRGYQLKKLAKRLLAVILKEHFKFPADEHTQALGFLMNRRGFSFLEEEYSKDCLNKLPNEVWDELSTEVQNIFSDKENIADQLMEFATNEPETITELFEKIQNIEGYKDCQELKKDKNYYNDIKKISISCDVRIKNKETSKKINKLSKTEKGSVEKLIAENSINLISISDKNLLEQMNALTLEQVNSLKKQLPDFEKKQEETKKQIKESIWNFKYTDFKLDEKENDLRFDINNDELNEKEKKQASQSHHNAHLHQLCYAVYKINNEIISGGRHRSRFFDDIKYDLEKFAKDDFLNNKHSPKYLKKFILAINENEELDTDKLYKLVCHISNFELKPLRKYFNNETYKNGDKLDEKNLSKISSRWFLKHWIVTKDKDNQEKVDNYKKLKKAWEEYQDKNNIIDFWLKIEPFLTIPPYQAMRNRRPPKCQSLLFNGNYLSTHYKNWQGWLEILKSDGDYEDKLKKLQSGKGKRTTKNGKETDGRLINDEKINLRKLQFILDTAKKQDSYNLNEIWSIYHKLQKPNTDKIKWKKKLDKAIKKSELPQKLKQDLDFNQKGSFAHFLNKYYQTRSRARDGRYFLIQEKKEKWLTDGKLLTLCTHKPRQKRHQWQIDLAMVLGISKDDLIKKIKDNPEDYFKEITGFFANCKKAAKAQKDHRGELKLKIYHELANNPKRDLAKLANKCQDLKIKLVENIGIKNILLDKQPNELNQKIALVFKFAQIHNIVFKDRSGFSKTCPVCSTDNAFRMQDNSVGIAKASRLPALSIRLIDGVVMRICDTIARQVAVTKWHKIQMYLKEHKKVSIPLILEQNRFEFEPSLKRIKGKKSDEIKDDRSNKYKGQKVSLYSGKPLGKDGEIDHIIPQASKYGTLNDEANLIYISNEDNQNKNNNTKFLNDLHTNYKKEIFDNKSDDEIKDFIYDELEGKKNNNDSKTSGDINKKDDFCFGKYLNFVNLSNNQQKAFRHALFFPDNDPLKQKVIQSLKNRNRTIVNGTQRYLAQCIADKIHRIARKEKKEHLIEFDYFEYSARWDDPKSTYNLRKKYGLEKQKKQPLYSHLIDAQLAFLIAAEEHQDDGSIGIKLLEQQTIWEYKIDERTGKALPSELFNIASVGESNFENIGLNRKKSEIGVRLHRSFHRPNFYAQNYLPLFFGKINGKLKVKAGFSWENSILIPNIKKNTQNILDILQFSQNKWVISNNFKYLENLYDTSSKKMKHDIFYISWEKRKIQEYLVENYSNKDIAKGKEWSGKIKFLDKLSYRVQKQKIEKLKDIEDTLNGVEIGETKPKKYFDINLFGGTIELPAKNEWKNLLDKYKESENQEFSAFIKTYFSKKENQINKHQKVRKVFSLPVVNTLGNFLQKRKSWNGQDIYQISPDSDSRTDGNKFSRLVLTKSGKLKEVINKPFDSKNAFKLKNEELYIDNDYRNIDPNKWFKINDNNDFPTGVLEIEYRIDNKTRPQIKIKLSRDFNFTDILKNSLTKAKDNSALETKLKEKNAPKFIEYTASGFNEKIIKKLLEALVEALE